MWLSTVYTLDHDVCILRQFVLGSFNLNLCTYSAVVTVVALILSLDTSTALALGGISLGLDLFL